MTALEVKENNKMIARFMGYEYIPFSEDRIMNPGWWQKGVTTKDQAMTKLNHSYLCRSNNDLRYYNEFNWLMPVVKKIQGVAGPLLSSDSEEKQFAFMIFTLSIVTPIETVYLYVVNFINWYNQNN